MPRKKLLSMSIMGNSTWLEWFLKFLHHPSDSTLWAWPLSWRPPAGFGGYLGNHAERFQNNQERFWELQIKYQQIWSYFGDEAKTPEGICLWNHSFLSGSGITLIIIISQSYVSSPHRTGLEHCNNLRETEMLRQFSPLIHVKPSLPTQ